MISKTVITRMDEFLRPLGFARQKANWNRRSGPFIDVVDLQTSNGGDTITINAGVLHPDVHKKCWATELPAIIQEPECVVRARIGELLDGKDLWWSLSDDKNLDDIAKKLATEVLPFLDRMHSFSAMEQFLMNAQVTKQKYPPPIIYLAILKSEQGNLSGACELLRELRTKAIGSWPDKIAEVAKRLGCSC